MNSAGLDRAEELLAQVQATLAEVAATLAGVQAGLAALRAADPDPPAATGWTGQRKVQAGDLRVGDRFTVGGVLRTVTLIESEPETSFVTVRYSPGVGLTAVPRTLVVRGVERS